jgi:hypothetical protein
VGRNSFFTVTARNKSLPFQSEMCGPTSFV